MNFTIDNSQIALLARAMTKAPEVVRKRMLKATAEANLLMEREIKERTPVGVGGGGGLRGSIDSEEYVDGYEVLGVVGSPLAYAEAVDLGTKPNRKMPPVQPIQDWVIQKLGLSGREARSAAFAIARSIGKKGTKAAENFSGAFRDNANQVRRIFGTAIDGIAQEVLG